MENFTADLFDFLDAKIASEKDLIVIIDFDDYCKQHQIQHIFELVPFILKYIDNRLNSAILKDVLFIVIVQQEDRIAVFDLLDVA